MTDQLNVLGEPLQACCKFPMTGFYRDGYCRISSEDYGQHIVCAQMTDAFLSFSKSVGNDLTTPQPEIDFPGLIAGDRWCLCMERWLEAKEADVAPPLVLAASHAKLLEYVSLEELQEFKASDDDLLGNINQT